MTQVEPWNVNTALYGVFCVESNYYFSKMDCTFDNFSKMLAYPAIGCSIKTCIFET